MSHTVLGRHLLYIIVSETKKYMLFCLNFSRAYSLLVIFLSPDNGVEKWLASTTV